MGVPARIQRELLRRANHRCERCGCEFDRPGLPSPHIHHKNGNREDNRLSNLLLLCPNCHSAIHHGKLSERELRAEGIIDLSDLVWKIIG